MIVIDLCTMLKKKQRAKMGGMHKMERLNEQFTREQYAKIEYARKSIFFDVSKIGVLTVIFILIGEIKVFGYVLLSFVMTRIWWGGIHKRTYGGCLLDSLVWLIIGVTIANVSNKEYLFIIGCICVAALGLMDPVQSPNRKKLSHRESKRRKIYGIVSACIILLISLIPMIDREKQNALISGQVIETLQVTIKTAERRLKAWNESPM